MHYERLIIGYHGCDRAVGRRVLLDGGMLDPSRNEYDWLGEGVYFWEHGPARALQWAQDAKRRGRIAEPFVLGAFIHLGHCLDLADTHATSMVREWHRGLSLRLAASNRSLPVNAPLHSRDDDRILRYLDCAVLNFGIEAHSGLTGREFQSVRGLFSEGEPAFAGSGIQTKTHIQIAVRDPMCILGYFKPRDLQLG